MIDPHLILRMKDRLMVHLGFRQYLYGNGTIASKKVQSHGKDNTETANDNADIEEGEFGGIQIADEKRTAESGEIEITHEDKKMYQVILDMVSAVLKENPGYELLVCGHSLGGALATMLGKYIIWCSWYCATPACGRRFFLSNLSLLFLRFDSFRGSCHERRVHTEACDMHHERSAKGELS
jgi:hypothetical protein